MGSVIEELKKMMVCSRCLMRFVGIKDYSAYVSKESIQKNIKELTSSDSVSNVCGDDPAAKRYHVTPCCSCLGVLQDECDKVVSQIESVVQESGFQFSDFVLQLALPVAVDLRQFLIHLHLTRNIWVFYKKELSDIPTVKEVWKWVVGCRLGEVLKADFRPQSDFQISVSVLYEDLAKECCALSISCPEAFPNLRRKRAKLDDVYNRTSVLKAINQLSSELHKFYDLPPVPPYSTCTYEDIVCTRSPLYLGGRYNKYSRELSQTPWVVDGERRMQSSVQELITDIVTKWVTADSVVFSASGREDVDVRMLGNGRPFVLEIINPRRASWTREEMKVIENAINKNTSLIAVRDLQVIMKKDTLLLKDGEEQKRKTYSALCIVSRMLQPGDLEVLHNARDIILKQKTPIRVLHRRTLATRDKVIHKMSGKIIGSNQLELKIETQAGTYVKEFIHSDFGRTMPSLGTILQSEVDILALDVESVHLDWPPNTSS